MWGEQVQDREKPRGSGGGDQHLEGKRRLEGLVEVGAKMTRGLRRRYN